MKKIIIVTLSVLLLPLAGFSQFTHIGVNAAYSTQVKAVGFGAYGIYRVNDQIKFTPNLMYYLPNKVTTDDGTQEFQWTTFNLDGNYVILDQGIFEGYGLMGLNLSVIKGKQDEVILGQPFTDRRTLQKAGLNIGAGMRFAITEKVIPFAELRYTIGGKTRFSFKEITTSQFGIFAGVLFRISEDKDRSISEDY